MKIQILFVAAILTVGIVAFAPSSSLAGKPSEAERFEVFLENDGLKTKLGLTAEQVAKLKKAVDGSYFPHGREGKKPDILPDFEAFEEDDKFLKKIYEILAPEQKQAFLTLKFQINGGLETSAVYATKWEVLDLTSEQLDRLRKLEMERSEQYSALPEVAVGLSPEEARKVRRESFSKITKEYNVKMSEILTEEQVRIGKKLTEEGRNIRAEVGLPKSDH